MVDINKIKVGLTVLVEFNGFLVPGTVMVIDLGSGELGIKRVFSENTERFPAGKVHTRYPHPNGHQPYFAAPTTPSPKDRNLLRLLGGFIITLAGGESKQEIVREVAEEIKRKGISDQGTRAQEIIAALR